MQATAFHRTAHAAKYLRQLSAHFAHKIEIRHDGDAAADFTLRECEVRLEALPDGLRMIATAADAASIVDARCVVDKHLVNFAFRENFVGMNWVSWPDFSAQ